MAADDFYCLVAEARNPERLFAVQSNKYHGVYAGSLPNRGQVLVGLSGSEKILALLFSNWGGLYDIRRRELPRFHKPPEEAHQALNDAEFHAYMRKQFGFLPGVVRVRQFLVADDDCGFCVCPLPWHFNRFLATPSQYTAEEQTDYRKLILDFIGRGLYVLDWGNAWRILDADGRDAG